MTTVPCDYYEQKLIRKTKNSIELAKSKGKYYFCGEEDYYREKGYLYYASYKQLFSILGKPQVMEKLKETILSKSWYNDSDDDTCSDDSKKEGVSKKRGKAKKESVIKTKFLYAYQFQKIRNPEASYSLLLKTYRKWDPNDTYEQEWLIVPSMDTKSLELSNWLNIKLYGRIYRTY